MSNTNPYSAPSADVVPEYAANADYGGFQRLRYFLLSFGSLMGFGIVLAIVVPIISDIAAGVSLVFIGLAYIALLILVFWIAGQRFKNIGRSPWNCLWMLVPLANLYFGWMALAAPEGYADHKKLDTAGIILTVLWVLMTVGSIAVQFMLPTTSTVGGPISV